MKKLLTTLYLAVMSSCLLTAQDFTQILTGDVVTDIASERDGSWGDYDDDGFVDLYTSSRKLYHNNGDGTFSKITDCGITRDGPGTWVDFDNDGRLDLFIRSVNEPNTIFRNLGNGTFEEVPGLFGNVNKYTWAASWADYDRDGDLDVFIANHYLDGGFVNALYSNYGDGTFSETESATFGSEGVNSEGSTWGDYNNDGFPDLFVANYATDNFLFKNNGDGTFTKITGVPVVSDKWSTGAAWGDYNNDGFLDLFVINLVENSLYKNNGDGTFTKITEGEIVNEYSSSRGCAWADFDNDGDLDLVVTNGWPNFDNTMVYVNNNDGTFTKVTDNAIAVTGGVTGGALWADYDNDGDQDLMCTRGYTNQTFNYLFRNNENSNAWISIKCIGTISNRDAIGARIEAKAIITGEPTWQIREIINQTGTGQQNSVIVHFGFGDAVIIDSLVIKWPSGIISFYTNILPGQLLTLYETTAIPSFYRNPSDQNSCHGEDVMMVASAACSGPIMYRWQKNGINLPNAINDTLILIHAGNSDSGDYRCIASNENGADTSKTAKLIINEVIPSEIIGFSNVTPFEVATYSVESKPGHIYEFLVEGGNQIVGTENSITVHWGLPGTGYIKLLEKNELGCQGDSVLFPVNINFLGVDETQKSLFKIYPDPATDIIVIETTVGRGQLSILSLSGQQLSARQFTGPKTQIDISSLPTGVYFVKVSCDSKVQVGKIVKY